MEVFSMNVRVLECMVELMEMRKWRKMITSITSIKVNVGILHFPINIALSPCLYNYMRRLPSQ